MKKISRKDIVDFCNKNGFYMVLLISISVASVIAVYSVKNSVLSSLEADTQKIFTENDMGFSASSITTESEKSTNGKHVDNKNMVEEKSKEKINIQEKKEETTKPDVKKISDNDKKVKEEKKQDTKEENKQDIKKEEKNDIQESKGEKDKNHKVSENLDNAKIEDEKTEDKEVFFQNKVESFIVPVVGEVEKNFSMNQLIYSKTFDEWRVHPGIDILAKEGTQVKAVADGVIEEIKNDIGYGMTILIRHAGKIMSIYSNLSNEVLVAPNQIIKQGDVIGKVGNTSRFESAEKSHLHFEILENNNQVDPQKYISFNKSKNK